MTDDPNDDLFRSIISFSQRNTSHQTERTTFFRIRARKIFNYYFHTIIITKKSSLLFCRYLVIDRINLLSSIS